MPGFVSPESVFFIFYSVVWGPPHSAGQARNGAFFFLTDTNRGGGKKISFLIPYILKTILRFVVNKISNPSRLYIDRSS